MSRENRFPGLIVSAGIPPTLMIATGHPAIGAATLGVVLLAWVAHSRMVVRAERDRDARLLDYAQTSVNMGGNPTPVITAMRPRQLRLIPGGAHPPDEDEFSPADELEDDDERPWVFLRQRDEW